MLKRLLEWFRTWEPAQLQAIKVNVVSWLALFGVTLSSDVDTKVSASVALIIAVVTAVQAFVTRLRVYAPGTVQAIVGAADDDDVQRSG